MTEQEMRAADVPWPASGDQLLNYIDSLLTQEHDYGTCVYAMSMAATAAFYYVASRLGTTGFQSSMADLDILRRTRHMKGPFIILNGEDLLYPQYDLRKKFEEWIFSAETIQWTRDEAKRKLVDSPNAHPDVLARWKQLAGVR